MAIQITLSTNKPDIELDSCVHCNNDVPVKELDKDFDYCEDCIENNTFKCDYCGDRCLDSNMREFGGFEWCEDCYCERTCYCSDCSEVFLRGNDDFCCDCDCCSSCCDCSCNSEVTKRSWERFNIKFDDKLTAKVFGIELEANIDDNIDTSLLNNFQIVYDGSLGCEGKEFVSCPFTSSQFNIIKKQVSHIAKNTSIDSSCGFHLHIYIDKKHRKAYQLKKIMYLYGIMEHSLFKIMPSSRQNNTYCEKLSNDYSLNRLKDIKTLLNFYNFYYDMNYKNRKNMPTCKDGHKRYMFVNFHSLRHRGTLEIRLHSGTTNWNKIHKWIKINQKIINYALKHKFETIEKLQQISNKKILKRVIKTRGLIGYMDKRVNNVSSD